MTIGQRIAQKRKELGLSQEALGEKLGVSRQSIYKWESDSALPEIEKLITLSRLFGVSIGALLGVEEDTAPTEDPAELTPTQLKMVEEISRRYIESLPQTSASKKHPILRMLLALILLFFVWKLFAFSAVEQQYRTLSSQVQYIQQDVENSIYGITTRVEEILESQNALTAERESAILSTDLEHNRITFSFRTVPKTFTADTVAYIEVSNSGGIETFGPFAPQANQTFAGEITTTLSDSITLSVVFETAGVRQTQLLKEYRDLYTASLPSVWLNDDFWHMDLKDPYVMEFPSKFREGQIVYLRPGAQDTGAPLAENEPSAEIREMKVGLFLNKTLVAWAEPIPVPDNYLGFDDCLFFRFPDLKIPLQETDLLCTAILATDTYGRTVFQQNSPLYAAESGTVLLFPDSYQLDNDPANWNFTP